MTEQFTDNESASRFELQVGAEIVYASYRLEGKTLYIDYVEAPEALRGTGAAGRLMTRIKALADAQHYTIVPICSYAASWLRRHTA